jgi:hypothetical protein
MTTCLPWTNRVYSGCVEHGASLDIFAVDVSATVGEWQPVGY